MSWQDLPGWFDWAEEIYAPAMAEAANFEIFVEVGVCFGRSLAFLAREAITHVKKSRIYGVDPLIDDWGSDKPTWGAEHAPWAREQGGPYNGLVAAMREHAREELEYVNLLRCRSVQAARMFDDRSVFLVFVDGSHHYEDVRDDIAAWLPKVREGGILAGHDYNKGFPGVQRAVWEAFTDGKTEQRGNSWWRRIG